MKTKLITPLALNIWRITPGARFRGAQDRFKPLFLLALAVLAADILYLLHLEAMYREDARSVNAPSLRGEWPRTRPDDGYGARVLSVRDGQPVLNW